MKTTSGQASRLHAAMPAPPNETDALIVGGGPAGLAAAIALRRQNIACVVVEARSPGIDKPCGEGLMPDSLACLASLGVATDISDGYAFRGIRFANPTHRVDALFPAAAGLGIRRPRLHLLLSERAAAEGARLLWNSHIKLPRESSLPDTSRPAASRMATINGQPIRFRWLIGADGHSSTVRRSAGLDALRKESLRFGFRTHYRIAPWSDLIEIHWGPSGQLYITPVAPDCVCVVFLTRDRACHRTAFLEDFPAIAQRLAGAAMLSPQQGAVSAARILRRVTSESVALIGDASGSADSITGEGLAMSFRQAHALASAIASGSLAPYRRAHAEIARLPHAMGALMLALDRWPALEARTLSALAASPILFRRLLAAHMGESSLASTAMRCGPHLGWNLMTARSPA